jgi:cytochrome c-type biogenesis protein CcmH/NrfG
MAASHAALGDWASAVESYEAANKLEPGNAGTMTALKQVNKRMWVGVLLGVNSACVHCWHG